MSWLDKIRKKREETKQNTAESIGRESDIAKLAEKLSTDVDQVLSSFMETVMQQEPVDATSHESINRDGWQWALPGESWLFGPKDTRFGEHWWRIRIFFTPAPNTPNHYHIILEVTDAMPTIIYRIKSFMADTKDLSKASLEETLYEISEKYVDFVY